MDAFANLSYIETFDFSSRDTQEIIRYVNLCQESSII